MSTTIEKSDVEPLRVQSRPITTINVEVEDSSVWTLNPTTITIREDNSTTNPPTTRTTTMAQPTKPTFTVHPATSDNLPSLATIVPRSFHPTNPYILKLLPDTPTIQQWWTKVFTSKIQSPSTSHLLTVISDTEPSESLGILSMQLLGADERGAGLWSTFPPTSDHDVAAYADVAAGLAEAREAFMAGRPHFVIELFGVDHEIKGFGLGKMLLLKTCEIADQASLPIFVMANASARGIYQHPSIGFELKEVKILPGELQYEEYMLVRPVGGAC